MCKCGTQIVYPKSKLFPKDLLWRATCDYREKGKLTMNTWEVRTESLPQSACPGGDEHRTVRPGEAREVPGVRQGRDQQRVDVVGRERHQIAGAPRLVEPGPLPGQAGVQRRAQLDTHPVSGGVQADAPRHAQPSRSL